MRPEDIADENLIISARAGNDGDLERILEKYKPLILSEARKYYIRGAERDDVIQEAMIGLFKAVQTYRQDERTSFASLAKRAVSAAIIDAIRKADTLKNTPLNDSVSLDESIEVQDRQQDLISQFDQSDILSGSFLNKLSALEKDILQMRLKNFSYREIGNALGISTKSVDNAVQRIRGKYKREA